MLLLLFLRSFKRNVCALFKLILLMFVSRSSNLFLLNGWTPVLVWKRSQDILLILLRVFRGQVRDVLTVKRKNQGTNTACCFYFNCITVLKGT
mgnify:CR=1 FL=1